MSIAPIDPELCTGCGICIETCPMDVLRMDTRSNKAVVVFMDDCMLCYACELDCPDNAIHVTPDKSGPHILSWG